VWRDRLVLYPKKSYTGPNHNFEKKIAAIGPGEVASACNPSYSGGNQQNRGLRPALGKHWRTYVRKIKSYRDIAQVVKSLPSKCKALSSNPSTTKNKKQKISEVG
jgi:hypothetical protein